MASTPRSAEHAERAKGSLPGGNVSFASHYLPYQVAIDRASGPFMWDLDGNRYVDLHNRFTTLVHGHRYPPILEAVHEVNGRLGPGPAAPNAEQLRLAELITSRIASIERVRFCNSGTEAGMLAARLARRVTGRGLIVKARTGYHGWYEDLLIRDVPAGQSSGAVRGSTLVGDYGDAESFEALLERFGDEVAAVFLEPVLGAGGILRADAEFYARVQAATRSVGALLVADEVITLRLSEGGGQQLVGLEPDLTMLGKTIGGGLPVGALGGRATIMELTDPRREHPLAHHGTFNGNAATCAAGFASLSHLTAERIDAMEAQASSLAADLRQAANSLGIPVSVALAGSLMNVYFSDRLPEPSGIWASGEPMRAFHLACLCEGLFIYPRGTMCLSTVMSDEVVGEVAERAAAALGRLTTRNVDPRGNVIVSDV